MSEENKNLERIRIECIEYAYQNGVSYKCDAKFDLDAQSASSVQEAKNMAEAIQMSLDPQTQEADEKTLEALRFMRIRAPIEAGPEVNRILSAALERLREQDENVSADFLTLAVKQNREFYEREAARLEERERLEEEASLKGGRPDVSAFSFLRGEDGAIQKARVAYAEATMFSRCPTAARFLECRVGVIAARAAFWVASNVKGITPEQVGIVADDVHNDGGVA